MTIKEKIDKQRGEYTNKREKKFDRLRNTKQYDNYYEQKHHLIKRKEKGEMIAEGFKDIHRLSWFDKLIIKLSNLCKMVGNKFIIKKQNAII
jgi:hypothetical protein